MLTRPWDASRKVLVSTEPSCWTITSCHLVGSFWKKLRSPSAMVADGCRCAGQHRRGRWHARQRQHRRRQPPPPLRARPVDVPRWAEGGEVPDPVLERLHEVSVAVALTMPDATARASPRRQHHVPADHAAAAVAAPPPRRPRQPRAPRHRTTAAAPRWQGAPGAPNGQPTTTTGMGAQRTRCWRLVRSRSAAGFLPPPPTRSPACHPRAEGARTAPRQRRRRERAAGAPRRARHRPFHRVRHAPARDAK